MKSDIICHRCGFPVKRGRVPIIWRCDETGTGRAAFCSLACLENTLKRTLPEPFRSIQLAAEEDK
jgi:hypothetical protein